LEKTTLVTFNNDVQEEQDRLGIQLEKGVTKLRGSCLYRTDAQADDFLVVIYTKVER
jgi:hypothetical protein